MRRIFFTLLIIVALLTLGCRTQKIKDGKTAFEQKQYAIAIEHLLEEIEGPSAQNTSQYADLAYMLGLAYKNTNQTEESVRWLIEAAKNNHSLDAYYEMAYGLKKAQRYRDAILSFQYILKNSDAPRENILKEIRKCQKAEKLLSQPNEKGYQINALALNTPQSDYAPLWHNGVLYFTSDRIDAGEPLYGWTGNSFSDIYTAEGNLQASAPLEAPINTAHNEGTIALNKDNTELYFTRCHDEDIDSYCKIYWSKKENGTWQKPQLAFRQKRTVNYSDPVLIESDSVLLFTSNDPTGVGQHDIYYSLRRADNTWSDPALMPTYLNTIGDERFPTWHDGTLYFSSDFLTGFGGLDIFSTELQPDGRWTSPQHLPRPINSSEDDFSLTVVPDDNRPYDVKFLAFFTSTRGVFGNDDIYEVMIKKTADEIAQQDAPTDTIQTTSTTPMDKSFYLLLTVSEDMHVMPDNPNSLVVGQKALEDATIRIKSDKIDTILTSGPQGVILPIEDSIQYDLLAGKAGYLNERKYFEVPIDTGQLIDQQVFELNFTIEKIYQGLEIVMENIYYDYDESYIREDAQPPLNRLIEILKNNPAIEIQLGSHTDCRGDDAYNQRLSQARAQAAVDYIINKGKINPNRLEARGYGETKPEIDCKCEDCSESEHQINRRTTFTIMK